MNARMITRLGPLVGLAWLLAGCSASEIFLATAMSATSADGTTNLTSTKHPATSPVAGGINQAAPGTGIDTPVTGGVTTALYQTPVGVLALKGAVIARLNPAGGPTVFWNSIPSRYTGALTAVSPSRGWAVGSAIGRYDNGWTDEPSEVDASMSLALPTRSRIELLDVGFASGSTTVGYAVGTRGTVLRYDASGKTWKRVVLPAAVASKNFGAVKVLGPSDVWVAGTAVVHYDGSTWTQVALPAGGTALTGLAEGAPGELWGSTGEALVRWNGSAWITALALPGHALGAPAVAAAGGTVLGAALEPGVPGGLVAVLRSGLWTQASTTAPGTVGLDNLVLADGHTAFARAYDNSGVYRLDLDTMSWSRYTD